MCPGRCRRWVAQAGCKARPLTPPVALPTGSRHLRGSPITPGCPLTAAGGLAADSKAELASFIYLLCLQPPFSCWPIALLVARLALDQHPWASKHSDSRKLVLPGPSAQRDAHAGPGGLHSHLLPDQGDLRKVWLISHEAQGAEGEKCSGEWGRASPEPELCMLLHVPSQWFLKRLHWEQMTI